MWFEKPILLYCPICDVIEFIFIPYIEDYPLQDRNLNRERKVLENVDIIEIWNPPKNK